MSAEAAVPGIAGILLAAGAGSRFGGRKLLQPLSDGTPIGVVSLRHLSAALGAVTAVVRKGDSELAAVLATEGARVIECEEAALGMGHSLACAIRATPAQQGWVVALGDMPALQPGTITLVARALARTGGIVVPMHGGERGHPVAFPADLRADLIELKGDEGARSLLRRDAGRVVRVEVDDAGILRDIDTQADLKALSRGASPPPGN